MSSQTGRTVTFQLSTSLDDATKKVVKSQDQTYTQILNPPVQVPYFAKPQIALWSLSFANTFANIDHEVFGNDKLVLNFRHRFPDRNSSNGDPEDIDWRRIEITIPKGNYNMSDLEYQIAKQIKNNHKAAWDKIDAIVKQMYVYYNPARANETPPADAYRAVPLTGIADPDIAEQWSTLSANDNPPLTFTELEGVVNQVGAGALKTQLAIHAELGPENDAAVNKVVSGKNVMVDMSSKRKRYVKPITLNYNRQSNRIEVICVGCEIAKGEGSRHSSTLATKTFGFTEAQLSGFIPGTSDKSPTIGAPHNDFQKVNAEFRDSDSLVWDPTAGSAVADSNPAINTGAWIPNTMTPEGSDSYFQAAPPKWRGIMLFAGSLTFKSGEDPITGTNAAKIDNTRQVSVHLPGLASGSYDRDGNERGAQVASVPIRAAPGDSESWEVSTPLFMPCRIAGSELTSISWYVTNETGQRIDLQDGHMEATVVLKWAPPTGDAPPPSSIAAQTDLERIIQPWASAMAKQPTAK